MSRAGYRSRRAELAKLRVELVEAGATVSQIAAAIRQRFHVNSRVAGRYACGLTQQDVADRWNQLWPSDRPLTAEAIPCPSAYDRARNRHRSGIAWSKMAIRAILTNPRYTGQQVWNRQHKDEVLVDVQDVALGHRTKLVWNPASKWVWSDQPAHPAIVDTDSFEQVQAKLATKGVATTTVKPRRTPRPYLFRGVLLCGLCDRRMQGHWLRGKAYYRCRFPEQYAMANHLAHPHTTPSKRVPARGPTRRPAGRLVATALAQHRLEATIEAMYASQLDDAAEPLPNPLEQVIEGCDRKIANYRALLDAGADPVLVAGWMTEATAERVAAQAQQRSHQTPAGPTKLSRQQIRDLINSAGDLRKIIKQANTAPAKSTLYRQLGVQLVYHPETNSVRAKADLAPDAVGIRFVSGGGLEPPRPIRALAPQASASAIPPPGPARPRYPISLGWSPPIGCPAGPHGASLYTGTTSCPKPVSPAWTTAGDGYPLPARPP